MSGGRLPPEDPREWLNRARSSLIRARLEAPGVYLEDLAFDAQQAAEKAIKAVLIHRKVRFPAVHDVGRLLTLVEESGGAVPEPIRRAAGLTRFAVAARYPGLGEPLGREEYEEAVALAAAVVQWAEAVVGTGQPPAPRA